MRAEAVVLDVIAPVDVDALRPLGGRSDAVAPVVVVGEAAARPAQHGDAELLQVIDRGLAEAVHIRDRRILPDPHPAVHARPEVLGEVAVELRPDEADLLLGMDHGFLGGRGGADHASGQEGGRAMRRQSFERTGGGSARN